MILFIPSSHQGLSDGYLIPLGMVIVGVEVSTMASTILNNVSKSNSGNSLCKFVNVFLKSIISFKCIINYCFF
nr:MAG TPA: hypothetical protein [Bacteriophage sp.]